MGNNKIDRMHVDNIPVMIFILFRKSLSLSQYHFQLEIRSHEFSHFCLLTLLRTHSKMRTRNKSNNLIVNIIELAYIQAFHSGVRSNRTNSPDIEDSFTPPKSERTSSNNKCIPKTTPHFD